MSMRVRLLIAGGALAVALAFVGWRIGSRYSSDTFSETKAITPEAMPLCPWRQPEVDLKVFFPDATGYRAETRILSGLRLELAERLGRTPTGDENALRRKAELALWIVGLEALAAVRADRLQHSELRFMEIARALMLNPRFLLLDEPAAGLSAHEIQRLGGLIKEISRRGTGVLLVEHHADLIFDICDHVTVLNLGRKLAAGTPAEIRAHKEVVSAYLGG